MSKYPQNMLFWRDQYQEGSIVEKSLKILWLNAEWLQNSEFWHVPQNIHMI